MGNALGQAKELSEGGVELAKELSEGGVEPAKEPSEGGVEPAGPTSERSVEPTEPTSERSVEPTEPGKETEPADDDRHNELKRIMATAAEADQATCEQMAEIYEHLARHARYFSAARFAPLTAKAHAASFRLLTEAAGSSEAGSAGHARLQWAIEAFEDSVKE